FEGWLEYAADLHDVATIVRFGEQLHTLAAAVVRNPDLPVTELSILNDAEHHQLQHEWSCSCAGPRRIHLIPELFERQAALRPNAIAIVAGERNLSYEELNARANQVAWRLVRIGVRPGWKVGLGLDRSAEATIALLGIWKAGGVYVPL